MASAQGQAVALAAERQPQLIMADIQLEDGGSGIEAVNEILAAANKPVVFITAYPATERNRSKVARTAWWICRAVQPPT